MAGGPGRLSPFGRPVGIVATYAAAVVAFGYALLSLYWAVGGRGLAGTIGGYVEHMARRGGVAVVLIRDGVAVIEPASSDCAACRTPRRTPLSPRLTT
jgi:hypothetical protein